MPQIIFRTSVKRKVIGYGVGLLALGVVVVGAIALYAAYKGYETKMDNQTFAGLKADNYGFMAQKKYGQGAEVWLNYANHTPNRAHKYQAELYAAALYVSGGQENQKAIETVKKAEAVGGVTLPEAELAATAYRQAGDKPTAIHYYKEAIRLTPHSTLDYSAEIAVLNRGIQELQDSK